MDLVDTQSDIVHPLERVPPPRSLSAFFVGDENPPRFVGPIRFPHDSVYFVRLVGARPIGDQVLLRYVLEGRRD